MNSYDLCMIEHIPDIVDSGITSFKIEGRMKSSYYVATVVKAYRQAIDSYLKDGIDYKFNPQWAIELALNNCHACLLESLYHKSSQNDVTVNSLFIRSRNHQVIRLVTLKTILLLPPLCNDAATADVLDERAPFRYDTKLRNLGTPPSGNQTAPA